MKSRTLPARQSSAGKTLFGQAPVTALDPIWAVAQARRNDPRPDTLDLVVGVYRDDDGVTPVMRAVDAAQRRLAERCGSKAYYASAAGYPPFDAAIARLVLGSIADSRSAGLTTYQAVGGTGALYLLATLAVRSRPGARVLIGTPTYVNHEPLFRNAGLGVVGFPFLDSANRPAVGAILDAVLHARPGDLLLLQGCCHNPTGTDLDLEDWAAITEAVLAAGVVPLIDIAYYGLGRGLEQDFAGTRYMAERVPEALIAISGAKAFGLYNDRVGAAMVLSASSDAGSVRGNLEYIARAVYSQPPHQGVAIVAEILEDPALRAEWVSELDTMRLRLDSLRSRFLDALDPAVAQRPEWEAVRGHRGMFSTLPLTPEAMARMRTQFGIYATDGGRVNIAGLPAAKAGYLASAAGALALESGGIAGGR